MKMCKTSEGSSPRVIQPLRRANGPFAAIGNCPDAGGAGSRLCPAGMPTTRPRRGPAGTRHAVEQQAGGETISLTGTVQAQTEINLSFRIDGRVIERRVDVGDSVEPGQLIALLDPENEESGAAGGAREPGRGTRAAGRGAQQLSTGTRTCWRRTSSRRRAFDQVEATLRTRRVAGRLPRSRRSTLAPESPRLYAAGRRCRRASVTRSGRRARRGRAGRPHDRADRAREAGATRCSTSRRGSRTPRRRIPRSRWR